jgi:RNA polymerase sigma-70 factor (ECF subfamily)
MGKDPSAFETPEIELGLCQLPTTPLNVVGVRSSMGASTTFRVTTPAIAKERAEIISSNGFQEAVEVEISDEVLMSRTCDGSREALALLFRRYARLVRTVAMRILRDDSEADDLLQDVFLFVHRNCSVFDSSKAAVRSWIVQMTYHRAIDRRRFLNTRHFYTRLDLEGVTDLPASRSENRESEAFLGRLVGNTTVQGLLDTLTEDQRNTLSLHFFEGYTFDEIAEKLDQSLGNIRNHYYRGLDKLRKQVFSGKLPGRNGSGRK